MPGIGTLYRRYKDPVAANDLSYLIELFAFNEARQDLLFNALRSTRSYEGNIFFYQAVADLINGSVCETDNQQPFISVDILIFNITRK